MRVVLDTNIVVSFLLSQGKTISTIFEAWQKSRFVLLISDEIVLEIKQVLQRFVQQNLLTEKEGGALLRRIKKEGELIVTSSQVKISKDKEDNKFLACAKDGKAEYLVTGDKKHLLNLRKISKTKIINPKEFLNLL